MSGSGAKVAVTLTLIGSAIAIVTAISVCGLLFSQINNFYDQAILDIEDFKNVANEAWEKMIETDKIIGKYRFARDAKYGDEPNVPSGGGYSSPSGSISSAASSASTPSGGNSGSGSSGEAGASCPPGPPGPPGQDGQDGIPGLDGEDGKPGIAAPVSDAPAKTAECQTCPPGKCKKYYI